MEKTKQSIDSFHTQSNETKRENVQDLRPKIRQLNAEEITQAETHSLNSPDKTLPGRQIIAQSGSPSYYIGKFIDVFLLSIIKKQTTKKPTHIWGNAHFLRLIE